MDTYILPLRNFIDNRSVSATWRKMDEKSLATLVLSRDGLDSVSKLTGRDAKFVVNTLDRALSSTSIDLHQRKRCTVALRKLCTSCSILPASYILSEGLEKIADKCHASGAFAEVWEGRFKGQIVALKALKTNVTDDVEKVEKRFCKEVLIWKRLSHPNVLPFYGVATSPFPFCMVSPWMRHGNIVDYLKLHPEADRIVLLSNIADGLQYLHENDLVHGDLKGVNILMNDNYKACLADFGLMTIISDSLSAYATTSIGTKGTIRWMAPELLIPEDFGFENCTPSRQSDIYAFGMVIYEVVSGNLPFSRSKNLAVIPKVMRGERPERPNDCVAFGLTDGIWRLAEECWNQDWKSRPTIHEVLNSLASASSRIIREQPAPPHMQPQSLNLPPAAELAVPIASTPALEPAIGVTAVALNDYDGTDDNEITFRKGDRIIQIKDMTHGWWQGKTMDGHVGLFPAIYVKLNG